MADSLRILYAADIHGSERCFRKWLNAARVTKPDVLVFGGDLMGKILHPIVRREGHWQAEVFNERVRMETEAELQAFKDRLHNAGRYQVVVSPDEKAAMDASPQLVHQAFLDAARAVASSWLELADERLRESGVRAHMMLGNDDFTELESVFGQSEMVTDAEAGPVDLPGGFQLISLGYSNRTPWDSPRELDEPDLGARIEMLADQVRDPSRAIFNFHVPPIDTPIDVAAELDENLKPRVIAGQVQTKSVGSTAVRATLERHQPVLSLHGHIHEAPGVARVGRTVAVNPGSEYVDGILRYAVINVDAGRGVRSWQLLQG
jgi:Icc-related predicted phosphoesterase